MLCVQFADQAAAMAGLDDEGRDGRFLLTEWEQVILARETHNARRLCDQPAAGAGHSTRPQ